MAVPACAAAPGRAAVPNATLTTRDAEWTIARFFVPSSSVAKVRFHERRSRCADFVRARKRLHREKAATDGTTPCGTPFRAATAVARWRDCCGPTPSRELQLGSLDGVARERCFRAM
jgi:hypothetical protein